MGKTIPKAKFEDVLSLDDLPKRNVIYQGTYQGLQFEDLADKYHQRYPEGKGRYLGRDQECPALPQFLTDVGYTGRWQPGPRVIDLAYLHPGTVIANFKVVDGRPGFPCESDLQPGSRRWPQHADSPGPDGECLRPGDQNSEVPGRNRKRPDGSGHLHTSVAAAAGHDVMARQLNDERPE